MHECVGLPVVALDEAEALHCVEELDRSLRLLTGQLPLRPALGALDRHRLAFDPEVRRGDPAAAVHQRELERLAVREVRETGLLDRRDVDENVFAAIIADDEAEALLRIEEFNDTLAFADDLRGHSAATSGTAAAAETAAATAAAAVATATAAAVTSAATEAATVTVAAATAGTATAA